MQIFHPSNQLRELHGDLRVRGQSSSGLKQQRQWSTVVVVHADRGCCFGEVRTIHIQKYILLQVIHNG